MLEHMTTTFTFADLFAGIGGFHAGLTQLGGHCLLAVEKDEPAARTYQHNWGIDPRGDVTSDEWLTKIQPGQLDVLAAGFPCQPFSKGGAQKGMTEARGTLFYDVCRAIEAWQPAVVMLENVRNLTGPKHTHTWAVIIRSLRELGYRVSEQPVILSPHWIDPAQGGTPQNRERVYILATRDETTAREHPDWAAEHQPPTIQLNRWPGVWQLEADLPLQQLEELKGTAELPQLEASSEELKWITSWGQLIDQLRAESIQLPRFPIWVDSWLDLTPVETMPAWKAAIVTKNRAFFRAHSKLLLNWAAEPGGVGTFPSSRRKLEWQAGDAEQLKDCLIQLRPSGLRIKKATHTGALVAIDQRPFIGSQMRRLSARECARLQGFPDTFTFDAAPKAAYKQAGNAVHVGSVKYALTAHLSAPETRTALGEGHRLLAAVDAALRA